MSRGSMIKQELHFIDESGDPGEYSKTKEGSTWYYVLGDIVVEPAQIRELRLKIASIRYLFNYDAELKSHKVSPHLQRKILEILRDLGVEVFVVLIDKRDIAIEDQASFLQKAYTNLLRVALSVETVNEVVIDQTDKIIAVKMDEFLLEKFTPRVKRVNLANSAYIDLLQIADIVTGSYKEFVLGRNLEEWKVIRPNATIVK